MMTFDNVPYTGSRLDASIELGQKIADKWGTHALMIQMSRDITGKWRANSRVEESRAIQEWVKRRVRYVPDPIGAEMMADPLTTIKKGGDCDDMAILAASLLQAIGHDARIGAVTWKGRNDASHAVVVDLTAGCIVDPVGNEPQNWPPKGFEVQSIKYRDKQGQLQSMNGLFSRLIKAVAKPFQKVFPAHTLVGKLMDPLGLTDPKRNLNLAGRVADVVGTAAAVAVGGYYLAPYAASAGSALATAAGKVGMGVASAALMSALAPKPQQQTQEQPSMTQEQLAAWQQYGPSGAIGYSGSGGGGGGGAMLLPDGMPMPVSSSTNYIIPLAIAGVVGLLLLTRNKKG